ncbi:MAG: bifunctional nuclease family protein [Chloroflexi bacterium]|nr:bifunctional nuclease family protein [Chloroflexota bacterium]
MIEMTVEGIRVSLMNYQRVVILKEKEADRYLPIWIGPAEADAITVRLQDVSVARPLTHDLLRDVLERLGAQVDSVIVNDLADDTFYARILLNVNGERIEIDSRPSDAIALAVRVQVPIFAEDAVLEKAGVQLDQEGQPVERTSQQEPIGKVDEEELQRMSAFRDFIQSLDLDDFDKRKS